MIKNLRLEEINKEVGQLFFDNGRMDYEIKLNTRLIAVNDHKLVNLNEEALKIQKKMGMELKLATPPTEPAKEVDLVPEAPLA